MGDAGRSGSAQRDSQIKLGVALFVGQDPFADDIRTDFLPRVRLRCCCGCCCVVPVSRLGRRTASEIDEALDRHGFPGRLDGVDSDPIMLSLGDGGETVW